MKDLACLLLPSQGIRPGADVDSGPTPKRSRRKGLAEQDGVLVGGAEQGRRGLAGQR